MAHRRWLVVCAVVLFLAGCATDISDPPSVAPTASPTVRTLSPIPAAPEPPPSGRLLAEMSQSSLDAAAGQIQVWLDNDTRRDLAPRRIVYTDPRFPAPIVATRLRDQPAQARRGFPLALPAAPRCEIDAPAGSGRVVERTTSGRVLRMVVSDETDVVGRYVASRCSERALRRVVDVSWGPEVADGDVAEGGQGRLVLRLVPTGRRGVVVIVTIGGSHLLGSPGAAVWAPDLTVRGADAPTTLELPLLPARCDPHAFMEGGNATAFRVNYTVDDQPGQLLLRMGSAGAAAALDYALASCGFP